AFLGRTSTLAMQDLVSARDTFNALKLERRLADAGIPLAAADEPIDIEGMNATTILVRRVKQGIAEWYRFQIKEKAWKGLREHAMDGWNVGPAPYGYRPERIPHPVPVKAAEGRTKTRLVLNPRGPMWWSRFSPGEPQTGSASPKSPTASTTTTTPYPPPIEGKVWSQGGVMSILSNPKYTGYMVFGRRRTQAGKRGRRVPSGSGQRGKPTRRSSPAPPGTPPRPPAPRTAPPATTPS
ncbi:MAG TPA: recombinase family protein, partial [Streptosporangiaceae bacterium]